MSVQKYSIHLDLFYSSSVQAIAGSPLKRDFLGKYFQHDLEYIAQASNSAASLSEDNGLKFALRGTQQTHDVFEVRIFYSISIILIPERVFIFLSCIFYLLCEF